MAKASDRAQVRVLGKRPARVVWWGRFLGRDALIGYLFVLPIVLVLGGIVGVPFLYAIWISFHDKILGFPETPFVGLAHYTSLLAGSEYWHAAELSLVYTATCIAAKFGLGFTCALILAQPLPARGLLRGMVMLPWASPAIVVVVVWFFLLNDVNGVFNWLLVWSGLLSAPISWVGRPDTALATLIGISIWRGFPFWAITLLAALQSVQQELYEAAAIDGATAIRQLWHITLPGIRPVLLVVALLSTIWTFNEFTVLWALTRGGPADATTVLPVLSYKVAMIGGELGRGAAISISVMPILLILIGLLVRTLSAEEGKA
mgnify:CR=1 FL=1